MTSSLGNVGLLLLPSKEHRPEGRPTTLGSAVNSIERTTPPSEFGSPSCLGELRRISRTSRNASQGECSTLPDGIEYVVVLEDHPEILKERLDANWVSGVPPALSQLAKEGGLPLGFGCLIFGALTPGTIPHGDAVQFLRRLYRPWRAVKYVGMGPARGWNFADEAIPSNSPIPWSFDVLETAERTILSWLECNWRTILPKVTIDVVIPSYRVQIPLLRSMLELLPSPTCSVEFIIVIDNPDSPSITRLTKEYRSRPDVHILVNDENRGASAARNRGMWSSTAEWVHFLDDDIVPSSDLLIESERAIRQHPKAAGFVGNVYFPPPATVATAAIKLSGVTSFWDIANRFKEDVPWGVTGNLVVRRRVKDGISFDLRFPKTGGGEDIDFCLRKKLWSVQNGGEGFYGVPEMQAIHPWWNNGRRTYKRFF
ncbi:glycosyltransferase family 2 protein, partial [Tulasnella calospora MUT 4182]